MGAATKFREIEEAQVKARSLIADIVPILCRLPEESIPAVNAYLEQALEEAKKASEKAEHDTAQRMKKK